MLRRLHLHEVGPAHDVELRCADRLNVLTGDNGLGKSFLLDVAWWALTRTWANRPARPSPGASAPRIEFEFEGKTVAGPVAAQYVPELEDWRTGSGRPGNPGIVIYAEVDGGFSVWDPHRNYGRAPGGDAERPSAYHFRGRALWDGLRINDRQPCEGLVRDWVGWQRSRAPEFAMLQQSLQTLSVPEEPLTIADPIRVSIHDGFDTPAIQTRYGVVPITLASAGVRRVAGLAYLLVWAWREHGIASRLLQKEPERRIVLLVDEPETHLHPKWQRQIVPALLNAINGLLNAGDVEVQVITATHSPLVLASLEPVFDPAQDALFDLDLVGRNGTSDVELRQVPWRRRGDAAAWLKSDVFDLKQAGSREAEVVIEDATRAMADPQFGPVEARTLDGRLAEVLADVDPFWIRWRFVAEQRGWLR